MKVDEILSQIDRAIEKWAAIKDIRYNAGIPSDVGSEAYAVLAATLRRLAPPGSSYIESAADALEHPGDARWASTLEGILKALRSDYEAGYLQSVHELLHASVFADFLEMADHLLNEGYKDPAAVLAGGVLEEHLRKLCEKNGIDTESAGSPKKADMLNSQLTKAGAYEKLDQKNVTAWLDLRNKAAHAKYEEYAKEQVALMTQGVRDLLTRHPA